MNLRDLKYVVAVADHQHSGPRGGLQRESSRPQRPDPQLEAEAGLRLFEREGRRAPVSDRAVAVIVQARATLAAAAAVTDAARRRAIRSPGRSARHHCDRRALSAAGRVAVRSMAPRPRFSSSRT